MNPFQLLKMFVKNCLTKLVLICATTSTGVKSVQAQGSTKAMVILITRLGQMQFRNISVIRTAVIMDKDIRQRFLIKYWFILNKSFKSNKLHICSN